MAYFDIETRLTLIFRSRMQGNQIGNTNGLPSDSDNPLVSSASTASYNMQATYHPPKSGTRRTSDQHITPEPPAADIRLTPDSQVDCYLNTSPLERRKFPRNL